MNTQTRVLFSALALALAASTLGGAHAQERGAGDPAMEPQAPAVGGGASGGMTTDESAAPPSGAMATPQAGADILSLKAGEIAGRQVYNSEGKQLGKVDMIGRDRSSGNLSAIVTVGGFLGFGGSKVAVPLEELSLRDDKLVMSTALSKKELRRQSPGYQEKRYEAVAEDTTLSQVAPAATAAAAGVGVPGGPMEGAPQAGGMAGFQSLDKNRDGFLTSNEVSENQSIVDEWQAIDTNKDERVDRGEFLAYEGRPLTQQPDGRTLSGVSQFRSLDTNGDGQLSSQEAAADQNLMRQWDSLDSNRDGWINPIEFAAYDGAPLGRDTIANGSFQALDRNRDGFITSDEAAENQTLVSSWSTLDTNQDNRLDRAEFAAFEQGGSSGDMPVPSAPGSESEPSSGSMPGGSQVQ